MIVYVNDHNEIKAVNSTTDTTLTALTINDEANPFTGWSEAKICCYKVNVVDERVVMMTPYVDSRQIEHFDQVGKQAESSGALASEDDEAIVDVAVIADENSLAIEELAGMISDMQAQIDELKGGNE